MAAAAAVAAVVVAGQFSAATASAVVELAEPRRYSDRSNSEFADSE